jgi:hypothetical protein
MDGDDDAHPARTEDSLDSILAGENVPDCDSGLA